MITTRKGSVAMPNEAIRELVEAVRFTASPDQYAGKRRHTRYAECMFLDAAEEVRSATTIWPVTMENVSDGGIAFWSKRALRPGEHVRVREFTPESDGRWMTLRVAYCIVGIRGFLIGAAIQAG